jgi:hypothetical protein
MQKTQDYDVFGYQLASKNVSIRTPTLKGGQHPNNKDADQQAILQQPLKNHVANWRCLRYFCLRCILFGSFLDVKYHWMGYILLALEAHHIIIQ